MSRPVPGTKEGGLGGVVPAISAHSLQRGEPLHIIQPSRLSPDGRAPGKEELTLLFRKGLLSK